VSDYFSFSEAYWVLLAAFLVSQTTRGTPFRQGVFILFVIIFAICISSFFVINIKQPRAIDLLIATIFVMCITVGDMGRPPKKIFFLLVCFPMALFIATFSPGRPSPLISDRMLNVLIGAVIGMMTRKIVFPANFDREFSAGVVSLLRVLVTYTQALTDSFLQQHGNNGAPFHFDARRMAEQKIHIEKILQAREEAYPEWVYETGFNPGLRSGCRFFLVNLERATEAFFSMNYWASRHANVLLLENLTEHIINTMQRNQELLSILMDYFENKTLKKMQSDFTSDVVELEKALHREVPANLELLDISPDYVILTAFVRDIRDLRESLLQLVMALPA
jgi:hypothetical protein